MVVMVPLAKCYKGHQPAISAGVRRSVWLLPPQMADGVDEKRRIEHGECASHTGKEKTAYSTQQAVVEEADEKSAGQAGEDQEGIVLVLPDRDGIVRDARRIFLIGVLIGGKEPSAVAMPESPLRIVRIFLLVTVRVMTQMIGRPFDDGILKRPGTRDQECAFDPVRAGKAPMGRQSMVADRDAQPADDIEQSKQRPVQPGVVVEISIERDPDHGTHGNGTKEYDSPDRVTPLADRDRYTRRGDGERW